MKLTVRERDVAAAIARGLTNKQVGQALGLSVGTVKTHLQRVMQKVGTRSRLGIAVAVLNGLSTEASDAEREDSRRRGLVAFGRSRETQDALTRV